MDPVVSRIIEAMAERGLDQKGLASQIGIRPQAITEWKKGVTASYTKYLPQIASALGVTVEYLVTGEKKKPATGSGDGFADKLSEALKGIGIDVDNLTDAEINRIARLAKAALEE